ncbi:MAG: hypothetical protein M9953_06040 [Thermomicrobiales bacterium]|nr:hypothetical protein [Thermomicrobiales bacterium]MCO5224878.1 hypothetical protein [Thermomicrobiales bacterium]MCO5228944.1 hypothetical protein [Thermomicrobiales bacterium]
MAIKQPKTMSVTEFKSKLGSIASDIGDQPIVVENHGEPRLMVFSAEAGEAMVEELERKRRQEILRKFEAIQKHNDEHNADLTQEEIDAIALQAGREIREAIQARYEAGEIS